MPLRKILCLISILTFAVLAGRIEAGARSAALSKQQQVEVGLNKADIVGKGYVLRVRLGADEATVSGFLPRSSVAKENDAKIDSVLIAKRILELAPQVTRVTCNFYEEENPKVTYAVAVTISDVKAFGSGLVSIDQLLKSIKVQRTTVAHAAQPARAGISVQRQVIKASVPGMTIRKQVLRTFEDPVSHLRSSYPAACELLHDSDSDTIIKLMRFSDGCAYDVRYARSSANPGISANAAVGFIRTFFLPTLKNCNIVDQKWLQLGASHNTTGSALIFTFTGDDGQRFKQQMVVFPDRGDQNRLKILAMTSDAKHFDRGLMDYNGILLSLQEADPASLSRTSSVVRPGHRSSPSNEVTEQVFRHANLEISYPIGWLVKNNPDENDIVKITSPAKINWAQISLSAHPAISSVTLAEFAEAIHQDFASKINFKLVKQIHDAGGQKRNIEGERLVGTVPSPKVPLLLHLFFFQSGGIYYSLGLTTAGIDEQHASKQFDHLVERIKLH